MNRPAMPSAVDEDQAMGDLRREVREFISQETAAGRFVGLAMDLANRKPTRLALDLLSPRAGEHILDVGCGTGSALVALRRRAAARVTGVDPSDLMARMAAARLDGVGTVHRASLETMCFPDASFDAALLLNMLYFCKADGIALARLHRTLKPGGRVVAYVTHRDAMRGWSFTRAGLHRLYDENALFDVFVAAGFAHDCISVQAQPITKSVTGLFAIATR